MTDITYLKELLKNTGTDAAQLERKIRSIKETHGLQAAYNILQCLQVSTGIRKPTLGFYDHTGHIIGGGQKYGFTLVHALKDIFDITIILNKPVTLEQIRQWYHLDLTQCKLKIIPLPFFEQFDTIQLDPGRITRRMDNPFHQIAKESGNYDFFVNNSMNEMVYPMAPVSSLVCHFPERRPKNYFYADKYTHVIYNSNYTAGWIEKKWKFKPHKHIFPPVDMDPETSTNNNSNNSNNSNKENIIMSVARFETGGSKKQLEMVRTFIKLNLRHPQLLRKWQLILAGGSPEKNDYLERVRQQIENSGLKNIRLVINCNNDELKSLYAKAKIFWHLCGLDQTDPALVEHFGMTIVEAMQNHLVPIVFDGGGQREIVEQNTSGYRVTSTAQLLTRTLSLIREPDTMTSISLNAAQQSNRFSRARFETRVRDFFTVELEKYKTLDIKI